MKYKIIKIDIPNKTISVAFTSENPEMYYKYFHPDGFTFKFKNWADIENVNNLVHDAVMADFDRQINELRGEANELEHIKGKREFEPFEMIDEPLVNFED
jgi:hypothetical protein